MMERFLMSKKKRKKSKESLASESRGVRVKGRKEGGREGVGSNYSRPCLPIHHKTSRSL